MGALIYSIYKLLMKVSNGLIRLIRSQVWEL